MKHPLEKFQYCPSCGHQSFLPINEKASKCETCGFVYYFNPSAAVACLLRNPQNELLLVRRAFDPAKGTLDLPGGFVDLNESLEDAVVREIKEETSLDIIQCNYLFSLPNIYLYSGFEVHTLDAFYECLVDSFDSAIALDDAAEIVITHIQDLNPELFGLSSVKEGVIQYKNCFKY